MKNDNNHSNNTSSSSLDNNINKQSEHFERFLDALDDYLYSKGWYVAVQRIRARNIKTYSEVEQYLIDHCYGPTEAREIVARIKLQTL